jgi:hypothetical protein
MFLLLIMIGQAATFFEAATVSYRSVNAAYVRVSPDQDLNPRTCCLLEYLNRHAPAPRVKGITPRASLLSGRTMTAMGLEFGRPLQLRRHSLTLPQDQLLWNVVHYFHCKCRRFFRALLVFIISYFQLSPPVCCSLTHMKTAVQDQGKENLNQITICL